MAKMYSFPEIKKLNDTGHSVTETTRFNGFDSNGNPIYDMIKPLPIVPFTGTTKIHGTNAGIGYNISTNTLWAQSRSHVLSEESTNSGFYTYVMSHKSYFINMLNTISPYPVVVYGEWCGSGIQKGVAVSKLQKRFIVFAIKIIEDVKNPTWLSRNDIEKFFSPEHFVWNVYCFETWEIQIDFNDMKATQNIIEAITEKVEKECPAGKYFGVSGIGEGVVWSNPEFGRFKVKGEKHSSVQGSTLAPIDTEKLNSIDEFVKYAATENRFNQGIEYVFTMNSIVPDITQIKKFLAWITVDITKEESNTLKENNLIPEDVMKAVTTKARDWFTAESRDWFVKKQKKIN